MLNFFLVFLIGFFVALILGVPILKLCKKLHFSQTILHYVDKHIGKSGTPTMGGLIFIFASIITSAFFLREDYLYSILILLVMFGYGLLGFLDDFIKIRWHKNEGLKPYQKIIGQVGLSIIVAVFVYLKVGSDIDLFGIKLNLGIFIIPFIVIFFVAVTNSVNLTDGLDGLAAGISLIVFITIFIISVISGNLSSAIISSVLCGTLIGILPYNFYNAKIFIGDSGAQFIGFILSVILIDGSNTINGEFIILIPMIICGVPLFDTITSIIRRKLKNLPIMQADKGHVHHKLIRLGNSHPKAVIIMYFIEIIFSVIAIFMVISNRINFLFLLIISVIYVIYLMVKLDIFQLKKDE